MISLNSILTSIVNYFIIAGIIQVLVVLHAIYIRKKDMQSVKDLVNKITEGGVKENQELTFLIIFAFSFGWLLCIVWILRKLNLWDIDIDE